MALGYTGHEHIEEVGLVNMNGRVYDPLLGRMLSPDNNITYPNVSHNYNRYSYALNNPLVFSDPNGDDPITLIFIGMMLFAGGHTLQSEAQYGHVSANWGKVGGIMKLGGSMLMTAGMPNPFGVGGMTFGSTIMNGGSTNDALRNGAFAFGISGLPAALSYASEKLGQLELFNAPNGNKESLVATINRYFGFNSGSGGGSTSGSLLSTSLDSPITSAGIDMSLLPRPIPNIPSDDPSFEVGELRSNALLPNSYFERAQQYEGTPYSLGGNTHSGIDCSGLYTNAAQLENRWYTWTEGGIVGDVYEVEYTHNRQGLLSAAREGDILYWPGRHIVFYAGNGRIFHAHGDEGTPTGYTNDLFRWWIPNRDWPSLYRPN